jgi:hypothetical protein
MTVLELVGGAQGQPEGTDPTRQMVLDQLAEAERLLEGARQRLEAVADRLAGLRRHLPGGDDARVSGSSSA